MNENYARPGTHHARFIDPNVPYHVMNTTIWGMFLLRPSRLVNDIVTGVLAKAKENWPSVKVFGVTVLSNHYHLILQGQPDAFSAFVGFFQRQISTRIGKIYGEPGAYWARRYTHSALPSHEEQVSCLKYILSNSVKENLVERCGDWPGVHSVDALLRDEPLRGRWFDGTGYCQAKQRRSRQSAREFWSRVSLRLDVLPAWQEQSSEERKAEAKQLVVEINQEAREQRKRTGARVLGRKRILTMPRTSRRTPVRPAPYEERRRCICAWATKGCEIARAFVKAYHEFQLLYRQASDARRNGDTTAQFPPGSWEPGTFVLV